MGTKIQRDIILLKICIINTINWEADCMKHGACIANQYVFLPSDPDELVDQLKLLHLEKLGGNDNPQLNEQIIAIVDKILEYECITTNQHQNIISSII